MRAAPGAVTSPALAGEAGEALQPPEPLVVALQRPASEAAPARVASAGAAARRVEPQGPQTGLLPDD